MKETWKEIPSFCGYQASSRGRIRSIDRVVYALNRWGQMSPRKLPGRVLKTDKKITSSGYMIVSDVVSGETPRARYVHQLVSEAFHGQAHNRVVCHLNHNKLDNRPENLCLSSQSENITASYKVGAYDEAKKKWSRDRAGFGNNQCKITPEQLLEIRKLLLAGGMSQLTIGERFGISQQQISRIKNSLTHCNN